ncbi:DSBA oxidoreductase [Halalkaliarchaeum desulfuricum]|uniref:DSBA oxidoreductase n=1 Tax=Halalkaliarchaeum desulfuricum TaxID=2055893 RepID=A0A343TP16_9EURY|nr:DsbA family protein [Halalkaliarchaeum desulfuricum]AUX10838.1 DSBA oxidoreductase [Halalkaliarchaeum desulfuricum]
MSRNEESTEEKTAVGNGETITVYSDYVCPFCYLGRKSLEKYREERAAELEIDWHPFDLRAQKRGPDGEIDGSLDDGKDDAYYEEVQRNVDKLRDRYGADEMLDLEEIPEGIDSFDAQVASLYVASEYPDHWLAFDEAIFVALWVTGRDVGTIDVLADLAKEVGLDPDEIRAAVTDETYRDRLREAFEEAQRHGVTAVPTFASGEHAARGAVPPEQLERLVDGT